MTNLFCDFEFFSGVAKLSLEDDMEHFFFRFKVPETEMRDFFKRFPKAVGVLRPLSETSTKKMSNH